MKEKVSIAVKFELKENKEKVFLDGSFFLFCRFRFRVFVTPIGGTSLQFSAEGLVLPTTLNQCVGEL